MTPVKPYQQKILDLYTQQELKLAELYKLLSEQVSPLAQMFRTMQDEELNHAQWVEYLGEVAAKGTVLFHEQNTRTYTLQVFLEHIEKAIARATSSPLSPAEALAITVSMEEALLERKVFDHFQDDAPDTVRLLRRLRAETQQHVNRVQQMAKSYR